ncbi:acetate--CoA ligase family protein [Chloroflexota bacterium]
MLLNELESKKLLSQAGIKVNNTRLATSKAEAIAISRQLGFPVILKVTSPDIVHKSDAGGVKLALKTAKQVGQAYDDILMAISNKYPQAMIHGISVQKMAPPGVEVIIGMSRDAQFGPVLMFGLGGIWVEVLNDVSFRITPLNKRDAVEMIREIKGYPVLEGYRGQEPVDISNLEEMLLKVSKYIEQNPKINELELNPVIAYSDDAVAVDARIVLEENLSGLKQDRIEAWKKPELAEIFSPRGVAVVGVSSGEKVTFANVAVRALKNAGFPAIYPINPRTTELLGLPCYPNIQSIPGVLDHVMVCTPAESALTLLDDCASKGVRSVHIFTAGLSESREPERVELEKALLRKAREGGFRIIGPNCMGLVNPGIRLITDFETPLEPGPIAFFSQSGVFINDLPMFGSPRGLRFSKLVSYGNALDVDESQLLEYFSQDQDTEIIGAYIEGVKDGRRFIRILREATAHKPVVIQKGGSTKAGQRAALSHTASLTSSETVFNALCRQLNVIQTNDQEELIDMLVILRFFRPLPQSTGVAIIGYGGGPSVLASDEIEKEGLHLPPLSLELQVELKRFLPFVGGIFTNPVDNENLILPDEVYTTLCTLGKASDIHTFIYHMGTSPMSRWGDVRFSSPDHLQDMVNALTKAKKTTGKPVILVLRPPVDVAAMKNFLAVQEAFVKAGLPVFHSPRQAARALARFIGWFTRLDRQRSKTILNALYRESV